MPVNWSFRGLAILVSLAFAQPAIGQEICELHVWAASGQGFEQEFSQLTLEQKSSYHSVLDAAHRLQEMDETELLGALGLPENTQIVIHADARLDPKSINKLRAPISEINRSCYYDWIFRPDAMHGPPADKNLFFRKEHGQVYYYSHFHAFNGSGELIFRVKGNHRGPLPIIEGAGGSFGYDTKTATRRIIEEASRKIKKKLHK